MKSAQYGLEVFTSITVSYIIYSCATISEIFYSSTLLARPMCWGAFGELQVPPLSTTSNHLILSLHLLAPLSALHLGALQSRFECFGALEQYLYKVSSTFLSFPAPPPPTVLSCSFLSFWSPLLLTVKQESFTKPSCWTLLDVIESLSTSPRTVWTLATTIYPACLGVGRQKNSTRPTLAERFGLAAISKDSGKITTTTKPLLKIPEQSGTNEIVDSVLMCLWFPNIPMMRCFFSCSGYKVSASLNQDTQSRRLRS